MRQAEGLRRVAHRDPGHAEVLDPVQLVNGGRNVPEGNQPLREQSPRALVLELGDRVVVDRAADVAQLVILDLDEVLRTETRHVRVDDLLGDAEIVEQLQPRLGLGRGLRHLLEALQRDLAVLLGAVVFDDGEAGRAEVDVVQHLPALLALIVEHDVRHGVLVLGRRARGPQVGRLGVVRIDVDDGNAVHGEGHERLLLKLQAVPLHGIGLSNQEAGVGIWASAKSRAASAVLTLRRSASSKISRVVSKTPSACSTASS